MSILYDFEFPIKLKHNKQLPYRERKCIRIENTYRWKVQGAAIWRERMRWSMDKRIKDLMRKASI